MENYIVKKSKVTVSDADFNLRYGLISLMNDFQELATEHAQSMGLGYFDLKNTDKAFWVLSKIKVKFLQGAPMWGDDFCLISYPLEPKNVKFVRNFKLLNRGEDVVAIGSSEWCILDLETRRIRRSNSVTSYPTALNHIEEHLETEEFSQIDDNDCESSEFVYTKVVRTSDLDINMHMNNVVYTRVVLDSLTVDLLKNFTVELYELHFLKEAVIGTEINVYKRTLSNGEIVVFGKDASSDQFYFKARIRLMGI